MTRWATLALSLNFRACHDNGTRSSGGPALSVPKISYYIFFGVGVSRVKTPAKSMLMPWSEKTYRQEIGMVTGVAATINFRLSDDRIVGSELATQRILVPITFRPETYTSL